jgi:MoaA/NifB/PqqE/SkfB family radical SAM enzyme
MFDPGSICNLRCVQCPREHHAFVERSGDPVIADKILDQLSYVSRLTLVGLGEPLLSDLFWRIVEDSRCRDVPNIEVNTNGTLLTERNVERLLKSHLTALMVSLDGATSETYNRIRRAANFSKVAAGIRRLTSRRQKMPRHDFRVSICMTLMVANIRELPQMVELACDLGVDRLWAQHLLLRSDNAYNWRIENQDWTFEYGRQHLSNEPALSNEMVRKAKAVADARGFNFDLDAEKLWLSE